jgi:hypothetical protein
MRFVMSALSATRMAAGLLLSVLVSSTFAARAENVEYSKIGRWSISYTKLDDPSGCRAMAPFEDETFFEMALFHWKGGKGWVVSISNPNGKPGWQKNDGMICGLKPQYRPEPATPNPRRVFNFFAETRA